MKYAQNQIHFAPEQSIETFGYLFYLYIHYTSSGGHVNYNSPLNNPLPSIEKNKKITANSSNFLIIQVESLDNTLINKKINGKEVIPYINFLVRKGIYFPNFFVQHAAGGSSDAEIATITGLLPLADIPTMSAHKLTKLPSLVKILKEYGYKSYALHANTGLFWNRTSAYKDFGFDKFYDSEFYEGGAKGFYSLDADFFGQSLSIIEKAIAPGGPFLIYIITQSMHGPWDSRVIKGSFNDFIKLKNKEAENYLKTANYTDAVLNYFLQELEKKGILKNTNIIIFGDHATGIKTEEYDSKKDISENVPLIILPAKSQRGIVYTYGSHIDLTPTILQLAAVPPSSLMFGRSLLKWRPDRLFPIDLGLVNHIITPAGAEKVKNELNPLYEKVINYSRSYFYKVSPMDTPKNILKENKYIAHALGSIDGINYTNSKEAFIRSYNLGIRLMEVDLTLTRKREIICCHGNDVELYENGELSQKNIMNMSGSEFSKLKINDKYVPLSFNALLNLLEKHPKCRIITDLKTNFATTFMKVCKDIKGHSPKLFRRFIIQIYHPEQLDLVKRSKIFNNVIFALNRSKMNDDEVVKFVFENVRYIKAVTVSKKRFSSQLATALKSIKVPVFVHTVNNQLEMYHYMKFGASGIYTEANDELINVIK